MGFFEETVEAIYSQHGHSDWVVLHKFIRVWGLINLYTTTFVLIYMHTNIHTYIYIRAWGFINLYTTTLSIDECKEKIIGGRSSSLSSFSSLRLTLSFQHEPTPHKLKNQRYKITTKSPQLCQNCVVKIYNISLILLLLLTQHTHTALSLSYSGNNWLNQYISGKNAWTNTNLSSIYKPLYIRQKNLIHWEGNFLHYFN